MHTGRILPLIIILIFCCKSRLKSPCTKHCGQFFGKFGPLPRLFDAPTAEKKLSALLLTRQVFLLTLYVSFFALSQLILRHRQVRNPSRNRCFRRLKDPFRPKAAAFRQANAKSPRLLRRKQRVLPWFEPQYPAFHHDPKAPRLQDEPAEQNILRSDHGGL